MTDMVFGDPRWVLEDVIFSIRGSEPHLSDRRPLAVEIKLGDGDEGLLPNPGEDGEGGEPAEVPKRRWDLPEEDRERISREVKAGKQGKPRVKQGAQRG